MLRHVKLKPLDPMHPESFSERAIDKSIGREWGYKGILITDDFGMLAVYNSKDGIKNAIIKAFKAGGDLILIACDPSLYYPVMSSLLTAKIRGEIDDDVLFQSKKTLEQN